MGKKVAPSNPEIVKYFQDLPAKARPAVERHKKPGDWDVTPWCAAFVNWCLAEAGVPHLGLATAAAWIEFGTPIEVPAYGCIVVTFPLTSTKSSTGHVAFSTEATKGDSLIVLGGNQSKRVSEMEVPFQKIRAYRWPTTVNWLATPPAANLA